MSLRQVPKQISTAEIEGSYFDEFESMIDDLYFAVVRINFDYENKHKLDTNNFNYAEFKRSIHRFNVNMWIERIEDAHKITQTDLSVKWLKYLKKYGAQFKQ
jgi:hypothetical protein